jgi:hypothetical protein
MQLASDDWQERAAKEGKPILRVIWGFLMAGEYDSGCLAIERSLMAYGAI